MHSFHFWLIVCTDICIRTAVFAAELDQPGANKRSEQVNPLSIQNKGVTRVLSIYKLILQVTAIVNAPPGFSDGDIKTVIESQPSFGGSANSSTTVIPPGFSNGDSTAIVESQPSLEGDAINSTTEIDPPPSYESVFGGSKTPIEPSSNVATSNSSTVVESGSISVGNSSASTVAQTEDSQKS